MNNKCALKITLYFNLVLSCLQNFNIKQIILKIKKFIEFQKLMDICLIHYSLLFLLLNLLFVRHISPNVIFKMAYDEISKNSVQVIIVTVLYWLISYEYINIEINT